MSQDSGFNFVKENKRAVLLLHGLTGSPFEMISLAKSLFKAGFDVYCPLLPGHCSGTENVKRIVWKDLYDFGINKYDELRGLYEEVYVSGLCLGALLAFAIAEERQDIAAISALSTTLFLDGWCMPWFKFLFPLGLYTILKFFYVFPEKEPYGIKNEATRKKIEAMMRDNNSILNCIPMILVVELLKLSKLARNNASKINAPFILFHSTEDDLTSIKSAEFIYNKASSEKKEFVVLHNSYHLLTLDNDKDIVAKKTIDFFNGISKKLSESRDVHA